MARSFSRRELEEMFLKLPRGVADCRDIGHPWQRGGSEPGNNGGTDRIFNCPRCLKERTQHLDRRGYILGNSYRERDPDARITGAGAWDADKRAALRVAMTRILG